MIIKNLPQEIQNRVYKLQMDAGNKPNDQLTLIARKNQGNFNWHESAEGFPFWTIIDSGHYSAFSDLYPTGYPDPRFDKTKWVKDTAREVIKECTFTMSEHNWEELEQILLIKLNALPI